ADLAGSNLTLWSGSKGIDGESGAGNYIYYGVREFAMCAINNGLTLHGGFIPYGATFLIFSEYARNALRMSALMKQRNIFVFTHDSIGLGEDGPTHQAVEQAATLRLIPNMTVWRPCDAVESAVAWQMAIEKATGPSSLLFSRQKLAHMPRSAEQIENISKGAYVLLDCEGEPEVIVIATGSEVEMATGTANKLNAAGQKVRVVSMPATDLFDDQEQSYRDSVLPPACRQRISVEAGVTDYWRKYVGLDGKVLGVDNFGESAPASDVFEYFGLTAEKLEATILDLVN
ncbi:MAG: transketolase, partial [Gammaproteobacteria bacterium]